jgi:polyisoprenoid-binding protein YceI
MTTASGSENSAAGQASAPLAGPASWQLEPSGSSVTISHKSIWGLVTVRGEFSDLKGSAEILPDGSARGRLEIGAGSLDTKHAKRDKHLRSADFFDVDKHPQIIVDITTATRRDGDNVAASGTLTVAGQTKPLTLTAAITEATDQAITLTADAQIDRADFGMTWNQLGMVKGLAQVNVVARFVKPATA